MCLKRWKSRRLATGSEALTGGERGLPCVRQSVAVPPGNGVRVDVPCSVLWVRCASPKVDRAYQSLEEARPCVSV